MPESQSDAVRAELSRVLASNEFKGSKRSQDFLRYIVENTLAGQTACLKERTIGVDVFSRAASYDPAEDATVRVKAGEVRKRLGLYYASQGAAAQVRIDLPAGTYVPEFQTTLRETRRAKWTHGLTLGAGVVLLVVVVLSFAWWRTRASETALDQFWAPVLQGTSPVSLCAAYVPVYSQDHGDHYSLLNDQFVGGGDLLAVSHLSSMLTRLHRPYQIRLGNAVTFQDLRSSPAILVGYSYTRWKEISSELRFFIDAEQRPVEIRDNGKPTGWSLPRLPADLHTDEDYAVVSRVFHPETHAMLVELAGITQYGTDAAADLVTDPDLMGDALRGAPAGWRNQNLQLVLHVKVFSGAPASPQVVKSYFW